MRAGAPRLAVIEHATHCPPARLDEWWGPLALDITVHRPYLGDALPPVTSFDGVVVLGGPMGANDDEQHGWLAPLKDLVRESVESRIPVLGICLGHQLVATALGGTVGVNPRGQAIGLRQVGWTPRAASDPLLGPLAHGPVRAVQWNDDIVTALPDGAVALATTPDGDLQAARFSPLTWGVQFHPEADRGLVARWAELDAERHARQGVDQGRVLDEIDRAHAELGETWRQLVRAFVEVVAAQATEAVR